MSQNARTINDLITEAFYQIGEYGVGEAIDGYAMVTGLNIINEHLDFLSSANVRIPFLNTIDFVTTIGKADYTISTIPGYDIDSDRVTDLVFATYVLPPTVQNSIIFPIEIVDHVSFYNNMRMTNLQSRPSMIMLENQTQYSIIKFYPQPDQEYPVTLKVKQYIDNVSFNVDISEVPVYYERYLRFALARELLAFYPSANWPQQAEADFQDMKDQIFGITADLQVQPSILLDKCYNTYWPTILTLP